MARRPGSEKVYDTFSNFIDLCLLQDQSLLWPDEAVWSVENLVKIKQEFIDKPLWEGEFWDKIKIQFGSLPDPCWKALADALVIYSLPSSFISPEKKYTSIKAVTDHRGFSLSEPTEPFWDVFNQGFARTSMRYHFKYMQLWLIFLFAIEVKKQPDRAAVMQDHQKVKTMLDDILEKIPSKADRAWDMRHAIIHMAFPDLYEHIISSSHKQDIVNTFKDLVPQEHRVADIDEQLHFIRQGFEKESYQDQNFNFYLPEIMDQWKKKQPRGEDDIDADLLLEEMVTLLRRSKQIILYGPPGTGKTYYALKLAQEIIAQDNFEKSYPELEEEQKRKLNSGGDFSLRQDQEPVYLSLCTFHPAFGYEEFIEGFRPRAEREELQGFVLQEGIFKRICRQAIKHKDKTFILVIDEINRGNIPRIFGELITLIEKDKRWQEGLNDNIGLILPISREVLYVPNNVLIIGTMNTADRSISLLDTALRRRFGFRELMPMPELLDSKEIAGLNLGAWLRALNRRVVLEVGRNLQIGHSYLMEKGEPIKEVAELVARLQYDIIPLLQEYCYDDYGKLSQILGSTIVDVNSKGIRPDLFKGKKQEKLMQVLNDMCDGAY